VLTLLEGLISASGRPRAYSFTSWVDHLKNIASIKGQERLCAQLARLSDQRAATPVTAYKDVPRTFARAARSRDPVSAPRQMYTT